MVPRHSFIQSTDRSNDTFVKLRRDCFSRQDRRGWRSLNENTWQVLTKIETIIRQRPRVREANTNEFSPPKKKDNLVQELSQRCSWRQRGNITSQRNARGFLISAAILKEFDQRPETAECFSSYFTGNPPSHIESKNQSNIAWKCRQHHHHH